MDLLLQFPVGVSILTLPLIFSVSGAGWYVLYNWKSNLDYFNMQLVQVQGG